MNLSINPLFWSSASQMAMAPHPSASNINMLIIKAREKASRILFKYEMMDRYLTIEDFAKQFQNNQDKENFIDFFNAEIKLLSKTMVYQTVIIYKVALKKLQEVNPNIRFGDLDFNLIREFDHSMRKNGLSNNTRAKYHKKIKSIINSAIKQGYEIKNPYKDFEVKENQTDRVFLSGDEVQQLYDLYVKDALDETKQEVLRAFLFSCFTSIRISDIQLLGAKNISKSQISFTPQKTKGIEKKVEIPLTKIAKQLLRNYKALKQFNLPSNQNVNEYLKVIAEKAEIDKHLTFHVGRHTFATLFLEMGGRVEVLQKIMGHYNIRDTMIYVHIVDKSKEKQISLMDGVINKKK